MTGLVVADTTVWSNFGQTGKAEFVQTAFPGVTSPPAVLEEIANGRRLGYLSGDDWSFIRVVEPTARETEMAEELESRLGSGEAACIAVAQGRDALLLTDDRAARRAARSLSVRVSGTLGVLTRLIDSGDLPLAAADRLLGEMIRARYRSPVTSLSTLL